MANRWQRLRWWLRTGDGKLVLVTLFLAVVAIAVYLISASKSPPAADQPAPVIDQRRQNLQSSMLDDLRGGMKHNEFVRKYGKAQSLERRPDGLLKLHYEPITVTFDQTGKAIEMGPNPTQ